MSSPEDSRNHENGEGNSTAEVFTSFEAVGGNLKVLHKLTKPDRHPRFIDWPYEDEFDLASGATAKVEWTSEPTLNRHLNRIHSGHIATSDDQHYTFALQLAGLNQPVVPRVFMFDDGGEERDLEQAELDSLAPVLAEVGQIVDSRLAIIGVASSAQAA